MTPLTDEGVLEAAEGITNQTLYIGLHTGSPPTSVNELTGGSYARTSMLPGAWHNVGAQRRNQNAVTLPTPTATWQDPTHYGLWTTPQGGVCLMYAPISPDVAPPQVGSPVSFPAGMLKIGRGLGTTVNLTVSPTGLELTRGAVIGAQLTASGGSGSYTYSRSSGPAWVLVNPTSGAVTGEVPANQALGPVSVVLRARDSAGATADVTFTITVESDAPSLTLTIAPSYVNVQRGMSFTAQLRASGGDRNYSYRKVPDIYDSWLSVTSGGLIQGINVPRSLALGELTSTFRVVDGQDATDTAVLTVNVEPESVDSLMLRINPSSRSVQQGHSVTATAVATGGSGQYSYSANQETIPAWTDRLRVQSGGPQAGEIRGAVPSDFAVGRLTPDPEFIVTDLGEGQNRNTARATLALTVTMAPEGLDLNVDRATHTVNRNSQIAGRLTASGGTAPYTYIKHTDNMTWLDLNGRNFSGRVPSNQAFATYVDTFRVTDSASPTAATSDVDVSVTVTPTAVVFDIDNTIVPEAPRGQTLTIDTSIAGGVAPYTYQELPGVPTWITIAPDGEITAMIPADAPLGEQSYDFRATDSRGSHDDATLILIITRSGVVVLPIIPDTTDNFEFPSELSSPTAMVSDGSHMWVVNFNTRRAYGWDVSETGSPTRDASQDFTLDSFYTSPGAAATDGTYIWFFDYGRYKAFAYQINETGAPTRYSLRDFDLDAANTNCQAATIDGRIIWVGDSSDDKAYAYSIRNNSPPQRNASKDFDFTTNNNFVRGMASNGTHIWAIEGQPSDRAYAYRITGGAPVYDSTNNFDLVADNSSVGGAAFDGHDRLWVADFDRTAYAYSV